jgi:hypothetical protein
MASVTSTSANADGTASINVGIPGVTDRKPASQTMGEGKTEGADRITKSIDGRFPQSAQIAAEDMRRSACFCVQCTCCYHNMKHTDGAEHPCFSFGDKAHVLCCQMALACTFCHWCVDNTEAKSGGATKALDAGAGAYQCCDYRNPEKSICAWCELEFVGCCCYNGGCFEGCDLSNIFICCKRQLFCCCLYYACEFPNCGKENPVVPMELGCCGIMCLQSDAAPAPAGNEPANK